MNDETILVAKNACEEFLMRVAAHHAAFVKEPKGYNPKECGALKRQSMEVTRAMAELRRPG